MGGLVAGVTAALFSFLETVTLLRFRPRRLGWQWWLVRVLLEAGAGALAWGLLVLVLTPWISRDVLEGPIGGICAGIGAPAILRAKIVTIHIGDKDIALGPAVLYEYFRNFINGKLDQAGAREQTAWLRSKVEPLIPDPLNWSVAARYCTTYFDSRKLDLVLKKEFEKRLQEIEVDPSTESDRVMALIQWVVVHGQRELVEDMIKKLPPPPRPARAPVVIVPVVPTDTDL